MTGGYWRSLSFRIALLYAVALSLSMAIVAASYFVIAVLIPSNELRSRVAQEMQLLSQIYVVDGREALVTALEERRARVDERRAFDALIAPDGSAITANVPSWPTRIQSDWYSIEADRYREGDEDDFSALSRDHLFGDGVRLIVGRDAEDLEDRAEIIRHALPALLILTILFGLAGGAFMSRTIGRRLEAITETARRVTEGDLGGRVASRGKGDDFDRLAITLNAMLARNQELFETVRRISDNVAHELRTPLARLTARLEAIRTKFPARDEDVDEIDAALEESARLQVIFNALLRIARIEGGRHGASFRQVDLGLIAADCVELYIPVALGKNISIEVSSCDGVLVKGDPDLLFQALSNVLDNALKYTPAGGRITVVVTRDGWTVSDSGPGVEEQDLERLTERFFRSGSDCHVAGDGLGLSLVAAIVRLHSGSLRFRNAADGFCVSINLKPR